MLYLNVPLSELRDDVMAAIDDFFQLVPREAVKWYATETMRQFKLATKRSFNLPATWWKDGARRIELRELQLKGATAHDAVPTCGLALSSAEREHSIFELSSNYIRFIVPPELLEKETERFLQFVIETSNRLPFVSGHGGYVIETNPYYPEQAQAAAYPLAMRYQAIDIATMSRGPWAVRGERIKNIGWLTLIGSELLNRLGCLETLNSRVSSPLELIPSKYGAILRAGEKPILGDINSGEKSNRVSSRIPRCGCAAEWNLRAFRTV